MPIIISYVKECLWYVPICHTFSGAYEKHEQLSFVCVDIKLELINLHIYNEQKYNFTYTKFQEISLTASGDSGTMVTMAVYRNGTKVITY